jgi:hypothetical protein
MVLGGLYNIQVCGVIPGLKAAAIITNLFRECLVTGQDR